MRLQPSTTSIDNNHDDDDDRRQTTQTRTACTMNSRAPRRTDPHSTKTRPTMPRYPSFSGKRKKPTVVEIQVLDDADDIVDGFPPYWCVGLPARRLSPKTPYLMTPTTCSATCEKQMAPPCDRVLYCSEAYADPPLRRFAATADTLSRLSSCRRRDVSGACPTAPPHTSSPTTTSTSTPTTPMQRRTTPPRDILPQKSPTVLPPAALWFADHMRAQTVSQEKDGTGVSWGSTSSTGVEGRSRFSTS